MQLVLFAVPNDSGKLQRCLIYLKQNGSHGLHAEAMRKPSKDPLPPPLTFSAEEKQWTEQASSETERRTHCLKWPGIGIGLI